MGSAARRDEKLRGSLRPGRLRAICLAVALASIAFPASAFADEDDPNPTYGLTPLLGEGLDPLAPANEEEIVSVAQPTAAAPIFNNYFGGTLPGAGTFTGSANADLPASIAVGANRVFVASAYQNSVYAYDANSLALVDELTAPGFPGCSDACTWEPNGIAYYRGEVFVASHPAGDSVGAENSVHVFDAATGDFKRRLRVPLVVEDPEEGNLTTDVGTPVGGLDVAWGEIWLLTGVGYNFDTGGRYGSLLAVLDAKTGGVKSITFMPPRSYACGINRAENDWGCTDRGAEISSWRDVAIDPQLRQVIADSRGWGRDPFGPSFPRPATTYSHHGPLPPDHDAVCDWCDDFRMTEGIGTVWGMKWLLSVSGTQRWGADPVPRGQLINEYALESVDHHRCVADDMLISYCEPAPEDALSPVVPDELTFTHKREWHPMQWTTNSVRDVAYRARETRIDWSGHLTAPDWQRGTRCLNYVVSDGDIYLVGAQGERWYEPARGFQSITFYVDGVAKETRTGSANVAAPPASPLCINTDTLSNGVHELKAVATVDGGRTVTAINDQLRVDHEAPGATLTQPGAYLRGSTLFLGQGSDGFSGVRDWNVQYAPSGSSTWSNACTASEPVAPGVYQCAWNTEPVPDGTYRLRATSRDNVSDSRGGPNVGSTSETTVIVDNTPPVVTDPAPAVGSTFANDGFDFFVDSLLLTQADSGSGMDSTTIEYNLAPDGSSTGEWTPAQAQPLRGEGQVFTKWDTSEVSDGLHRVRATSRDRAGNTRRTEWQVVMSSARRCPGSDAQNVGTPHRCYAGISSGLMEGARGRIKLPGFVPQGGGFSANVYGQYGSVGDTLETGTINHNCPDDEEKEEANHWFAYANLQVPAGDVEAGPCFKRLDKSSETGFAVITSDRGWAHVEISGQVKAIQENEHRYHIGDGYYSTVYGEAKRFGREIGGDFLGAQLLKENSGWINPTKFNSGPVDKGDGYIAKYRGGDISGFFCVTYQPRRNCNAP